MYRKRFILGIHGAHRSSGRDEEIPNCPLSKKLPTGPSVEAFVQTISMGNGCNTHTHLWSSLKQVLYTSGYHKPRHNKDNKVSQSQIGCQHCLGKSSTRFHQYWFSTPKWGHNTWTLLLHAIAALDFRRSCLHLWLLIKLNTLKPHWERKKKQKFLFSKIQNIKWL